MAKRFKKDDIVYLPVKIGEVEHEDRWYDYVVRTPAVDGVKAEFPFCVKDEEVKTAEEVLKENYPFWDGVKQMDRITALEAENASLKESLHEASEENLANDEALAQMNIKKAELEARCKELEDANRSLTKACSEWQTAAQAHFKTMEKLREENKKLKQQLAERDELLSDAADRIKTLEEAADRSIFFEKIANQQEVIDALVEKIRRLKGGET